MDRATNKNPQRGRLSFFDLFVILAAVAAAVMLSFVSRGDLKFFKREESVSVTYKIEMADMLQVVADSAQSGELIFDGYNNTALGKIVNIEVEPHSVVVPNRETGEFVSAVVPERYKLILTCEVRGIIRDEYVLIDGYRLSAGNEILVQSRRFSGVGRCFSVLYK